MRGFIALLIVSVTLFALSSGAPEFTCTTCHVNAGKADFKVLGLPLTYSPGGVYKVTIVITKGPKCEGVCGGFAVIASGGKLMPLDEKTQLLTDARTGEQMLTHTALGAKCRKWTFEWIAPEKPEKVTFKIAVIAANGDGTPLGDAYAFKEITLTPATGNTYTMIGNVLSVTITLTERPVTVTHTVTQTITRTVTQTSVSTVTVVNKQVELLNKVLLLLLGLMMVLYILK